MVPAKAVQHYGCLQRQSYHCYQSAQIHEKKEATRAVQGGSLSLDSQADIETAGLKNTARYFSQRTVRRLSDNNGHVNREKVLQQKFGKKRLPTILIFVKEGKGLFELGDLVLCESCSLCHLEQVNLKYKVWKGPSQVEQCRRTRLPCSIPNITQRFFRKSAAYPATTPQGFVEGGRVNALQSTESTLRNCARIASNIGTHCSPLPSYLRPVWPSWCLHRLVSGKTVCLAVGGLV
jgi:hypothetical protein